MSKFWSKYSKDIFLMIAALICIVLMAVSVVMLTEFSEGLQEQAGVKGLLYATDTSTYLEKIVDELIHDTQMGSQILADSGAESTDDFANRLRALGREDRYTRALFGRFFLGDTEYTMGGMVYSTAQEDPIVLELVKSKQTACAGYVVDHQYNVNAIAFVTPVENCAYADALVLYYPVDIITNAMNDVEEDYITHSEFTGLCTEEGQLLALLYRREGESVQLNSNAFEYLRDRINDKSTIDEIKSVMSAGKNAAFNVAIGSDDCVVSVCSVGVAGASFSIVGLYRNTEIYSSGYSIISTLLTLLFVFFTIFLLFAIYAIINRRRTNKRILTLNDTDQRLQCDSRIKFERDARTILDQNRSSNFAIAVVELKHYRYMSDQLGVDLVTQILMYLKMLFEKAMQLNESFGYMGSGRFVLLFHYREPDQLLQRLGMIANLARGYSGKLPASYNIDIYGGIYETKNGFTDEITKMVDYALEAKDSGNAALHAASFRFYNEELQQAHIQQEYIEVHMNSALENKNFIVFYQPKYNIKGDRPDGSEALVRWYNPEQDQYMVPGLFLPLFEANGFIVKLDKYVYEQVCTYMEQAVALGQPLIPVSVNVSRATAAQADFLDYYISRKKAHRIADGFLCIEFTESFAYENYDALREMTAKLHQNGFKCSIDDFGSGYSSYNILKELPMDEIKLDQFFIHRGLSEERDNAILSSVINVAKQLNMKVTQEGVETPEQLELLTKLGCDVIQGYHYAKPLFLSDYVDFISRASHSHYRFNK